MAIVTYIRKKNIKGHEYYYEERCIWKDGKPKKEHVRYIGKSLKQLSGTAQEKKSNRLSDVNISTVPDKSGAFYLYNRRGSLIFVGSADNLRTQIDKCDINQAYYFRWRGAKTVKDAELMALEDINKYDPKYNQDN